MQPHTHQHLPTFCRHKRPDDDDDGSPDYIFTLYDKLSLLLSLLLFLFRSIVPQLCIGENDGEKKKKKI